MADEANGAGAAAPRLQILTQYIRDLSFENIAAQKGISSTASPTCRSRSISTCNNAPRTGSR